jgi:hypothetical protein
LKRTAFGVSALLVAIGLVLVIETALVGGELGYVLGTLFVLAGGLRLYLLRQRA